jgi:hypothetical protein
VKPQRDEYAEHVDIYKLASEVLVHDIVPGSALRTELITSLAYAENKVHAFSDATGSDADAVENVASCASFLLLSSR